MITSGISCKFPKYDKNYEILASIRLYQFLTNENGQYKDPKPSKHALYRLKLKGLDMMITDETNKFIGLSFEKLISAMNYFKLSFNLYHDSEIVLSNVSTDCECDIALITKSENEIEKLYIATSKYDIHYIPEGLKISGKKTNEDSSYITKLGSLIDQELSPDPLEENDVNLRNVEENFKINLEVWEKRQISTYEKSYTCIYKGTRYENSLKFHYVDGWGKLIFIVNENEYFKTFYKCPNKKFKCFYTTNSKFNFDRHFKVCIDPKTIDAICTQKEYGSDLHPLARLICDGILSQEPEMNNFVFFDIESLVVKSPVISNKTDILATHKLLSISATASLRGKFITKTWVIDDSDEKSEIKIVDKFIDFLTWADDTAEPDPEVLKSMKILDQKIEYENERLESLDQYNSPKLCKLKKLIKDLEKYLNLNVFGYNSSKYDLQILMARIIQSLEKRNLISGTKDSGIKILKKGSAYFSVMYANIHFKDLMAFTSPMSLDKYLKTWTSNENKLVSC